MICPSATAIMSAICFVVLFCVVVFMVSSSLSGLVVVSLPLNGATRGTLNALHRSVDWACYEARSRHAGRSLKGYRDTRTSARELGGVLTKSLDYVLDVTRHASSSER